MKRLLVIITTVARSDDIISKRTNMAKIVAIGGGEIGRAKEDGIGFYPVETTAIDQAIVRLTDKRQPTLLFIPTASYDSVGYYEVVRQHFQTIGFKSIDVLYLSDKQPGDTQIRNTILSHDAIYVGGGNTLRMMTIWRKFGIDTILTEAMQRNIVLSGISAGSICWFSSGSSDSRKFSSNSKQLINVTGLGYIDALHCPHYDAEPFRQPDLKRRMKNSSKVAIALDNGAALEVIDHTYRIITSKPNAKARKIYWKHGQYYVEEISASKNYNDLSILLQK